MDAERSERGVGDVREGCDPDRPLRPVAVTFVWRSSLPPWGSPMTLIRHSLGILVRSDQDADVINVPADAKYESPSPAEPGAYLGPPWPDGGAVMPGDRTSAPPEPVNLYETAVRTIYWVELA